MQWEPFHAILKYNENQNLSMKRRKAFLLEIHLPQELLGKLEQDIFLLLEKLKSKTRKGCT